jgi:uncharacterized OB-fold protein
MDFGYISWLPETELISTFAEGLRQNKLMGTKCRDCGTKYLPPRNHCRCGSSRIDWFEAPSKGKILTYSLIAKPSENMYKYAPYMIIIVELDDGLRILAELSNSTLKSVKVGMQVEVVTCTIEGKGTIYKFVPI